MQQFLTFVRKEFFHIFRDRRTMLILLAMPIAQILLFGFAISTEVRNTKVAVLDMTKDITTQKIVAHFEASPYFEVTKSLDTSADIETTFRRGEAGLVIVFGEDFTNRLQHGGDGAIQLIADASEPNQAQMVMGYARSILAANEIFNPQVASYDAKSRSTITDGSMAIDVRQRLLFNPQAKSAYNFVPGVMGMVLLIICTMMTSISIVREKETGTMEILLASPMPPMGIILAKALPYFALSAVNLATILLLSAYVLAVPVNGSLALLILLSLLYIFMALSLGLLISTLVQSQMAAMLISAMGMLMPTIILSGLMFPIESMPSILQWISSIVPARWFISAVRKVMIEGVGIQYVGKELLILTGMTLVALGTSLKMFKIRLE